MTLQPYEDDISGTVRADGTAAIPWNGLRGTYGSLIVIAQATGSPRWQVLKQGAPVAVGRGPSSPMTLPVVLPGQKYTLALAGGQPGSAISAHFVGYHSDVGLAELPLAPPTAGTIATDVAAPQFTVGTITALALGSAGPVLMTLPPGTQSIGFLVWESGAFGLPVAFTIAGSLSGNDYVNIGAAAGATLGAGGPQWASFAPLSDTSVQVSVTAGVAPVKIDIIASPLALAVDIVLPAGAVIPVQEGSSPPPWQAPDANFAVGLASIAAGATVVLVPASSLQFIHVHEAQFHIVGAAGSFGRLEDSAGPTALRNLSFGLTDVYPFEFHGAATNAAGQAGTAFQIHNTSGVASGAVNGGGGYSYGST